MLKKISSIIFLLLLLSGCSTYRSGGVLLTCDQGDTRLPLCGTMPCTANIIGCCIQEKGCIVRKLTCSGVQVIQVGDYVKLVLPSDLFFRCGTSIINTCTYPTLNLIGDFICCPDKTNVKVAGYTDNCGSCLRNLALSRQQAQAIADYLWKYRVDARVMYARGYGECFPIACNNSCKGRSLNRRIEITLRRITDYYDY